MDSSARAAPSAWLAALRNRLIGAPRVQRLSRRLPVLRGIARRDGERLFDLMAGFVYAQTLAAAMEFGLLERLRDGRARTVADLGLPLADQRAEALCRAAAGIGLVDLAGEGRFRLGRMGIVALSAPGIAALVRHHALFYRDLADPAALLRGGVETELAGFWSYVQGGAVEPEQAAAYSALMASTQALVADEVLDAVRLDDVRHLVDVGGGTGAFLTAVGRRYPEARLTLFDLPEVVAGAAGRFTAAGGDFRRDPLPEGADTISLVRVLFDHDDAVVSDLLARVAAALPRGGRVIVAETMAGARPDRFGDTYFGFYTMAMGSGKVRSAAQIRALLRAAGFRETRVAPTERPFIARVVIGVR